MIILENQQRIVTKMLLILEQKYIQQNHQEKLIKLEVETWKNCQNCIYQDPYKAANRFFNCRSAHGKNHQVKCSSNLKSREKFRDETLWFLFLLLFRFPARFNSSIHIFGSSVTASQVSSPKQPNLDQSHQR